jgi:hypothetical protein
MSAFRAEKKAFCAELALFLIKQYLDVIIGILSIAPHLLISIQSTKN